MRPPVHPAAKRASGPLTPEGAGRLLCLIEDTWSMSNRDLAARAGVSENERRRWVPTTSRSPRKPTPPSPELEKTTHACGTNFGGPTFDGKQRVPRRLLDEHDIDVSETDCAPTLKSVSDWFGVITAEDLVRELSPNPLTGSVASRL